MRPYPNKTTLCTRIFFCVPLVSATGVDQSTESKDKAQAPGSSTLVTHNLTKH